MKNRNQKFIEDFFIFFNQSFFSFRSPGCQQDSCECAGLG